MTERFGVFSNSVWDQLDFAYLFVRGKEAVEFAAHVLHGRLKVCTRYAKPVHSLIIRIYQRHKPPVALHHEAFRDKRYVVELGLDFLRIDVLP